MKLPKAIFHIWVDDQETIGYRTPGWPKHMAEIIGLIWLPNGSMVELWFLNVQNECQVQRCYAKLTELFPGLSTAFAKHFEFCKQDSETAMANPNLQSRILEFEE